MKYNQKILQKEIGRLYSLSYLIIFVSTSCSFAIGYFIGYILSLFNKYHGHPYRPYNHIELFIGIMTGLIGLAGGLARSFKLRLEAQKLLCLVSIKQDTELLLSRISESDGQEENKELKSEKKFSMDKGNDITEKNEVDNAVEDNAAFSRVHFHFNKKDDL